MLKKTINYVDYNGVERSEDFFFNLSRAELAEMELGIEGQLSEMMKKIVKTKDVPSIVKMLKQIILKAYGEKSPDGRRFIKSDAISEAFSQTEAYSELFMELGGNAEAASAFFEGIIPKIDAVPATPALPTA